MENKAVFPVFYLPPISWFVAFVNENKNIVLEQCENFTKQTYRNRTCIFGANGKLSLMIPMNHKSSRIMKEIQVSDAENWRSQHWKSIKNAYQNAPYFEFYEAKLKKIFENKETSLLKFNLFALNIILEILKEDKTYTWTSDYQSQINGSDYRISFSTKADKNHQFKDYYQTFSDKLGYIENLSIIDLICNLGPESFLYLKQQSIN